MLCYSDKNILYVKLKTFSDACDLKTWRSITRFIVTIGNLPTSWCSKLQQCISTSTAESEYYSLSGCGKHWIWYLNLHNEQNFKINNIGINIDNKATIHNVENQTINPKTKHVDIRVHYIRELIRSKNIKLKYNIILRTDLLSTLTIQLWISSEILY